VCVGRRPPFLRGQDGGRPCRDRHIDEPEFTPRRERLKVGRSARTARAAAVANLDLAIAKTCALAGTSHLEFRWEIFNVFNRTNFDIPNRIFGTPNFGRIFSAKNPREMQFGLRVAF
jgi:hypothetical protein